jgi:TonB family protein
LFEFTVPEENAPQSPRPLAVSIAVHGLAVLLLFAIKFSGVARFPAAPEHFTLLAPAREAPIKAPKIHPPRAREFHPVAPAHLTLPAMAVIAAPAIEIPKPVVPEIPHITPAVLAIKASGFSEAKPAAPLPPSKPILKNSGFENTEAAAAGPARSVPASVGSFDSAHQAEGAPARLALARPAGFSEASTESSSAARRGAITSAAFGDTTVDRNAPVKQAVAAARLTPVEILSKPKPVYTPEARAKRIEGEVLLDVQFNVSGEVRILRVARGLGAGLDETAIAAAQGIRFRPATRDGAQVDATALVHIVFQLAN